MTLRVGITRALPEAETTAARVREHGAEPVLVPLLTIVPCAFDTSIAGAQALLFSSSNGVRAFPAVKEAASCVVLAVGDATARAARDAGFRDVRSADGDVQALARLAITSLDPAKGKLIHIRGTHVAGNLSQALVAAGFELEPRIAYTAVAASSLPEAFTAPLDVVLFHSARAAEAFLALGAPNSANLTAGCLSKAVAEAASGVSWKRIIVAPAPRDNDLIAAVLAP